jgi:hypothetical protein
MSEPKRRRDSRVSMAREESPVMWLVIESSQIPAMRTTTTIPMPSRACARFFVREARAKAKTMMMSGRVNCIRKRRPILASVEKPA